MSQIRTIEGARHLLTVENKINRYDPTGPLAKGTQVYYLRKNGSGYYHPCVAYITEVTATGRIGLDLWHDRSEHVFVNAKSVLWPREVTV